MVASIAGIAVKSAPLTEAPVDVLRTERARCGWPEVACHPKRAEGERRMVDQTGASWNQTALWLRRLEGLKRAA